MGPTKDSKALTNLIKLLTRTTYEEQIYKKGSQNRPHILYLKNIEVTGAKWILNCLLRSLVIKKSRIHVTKEAMKVWKQFFEGDIKDYSFTASLLVKKSGKLPLYKANGKSPRWRYLKKGSRIHFNNIFHDEHIVPVGRIIVNLVNLYSKGKLTDKNIYKELSKIHIVKMLKKEDKNLSKTMKKLKIKDTLRPDSWSKERDGLYKKAGIKLIN